MVTDTSATAVRASLQGMADFPGNAWKAWYNTVVSPVTVATTADAHTLSFQVGWNADGIASAAYVSGGSFSGTGTCTLTTFNGAGGTLAAANIAVASGVPGAVTITNTGRGYTGTSTSAALGNGTATCSGTATITSVLGGAQGNAMRLMTLMVEELY
jgi:hypothetical protein